MTSKSMELNLNDNNNESRNNISYNNLIKTKENNNSNQSKMSISKQIKKLYENNVPKFESATTLQRSAHNIIFTKAERFPSKANISIDALYTPRYLKVAPSAGIGYGNRGKLDKKGSNYPSPCSYKIASFIEDNLKKKKGPVIASRHNIKNNECKNPGPGQYKFADNWLKQNGITIVQRHNFYYDELMKGRACISPQRYSPQRRFIECRRYDKIGFGYGNRGSLNSSVNTPGVGTYNIRSSFDLKHGKYPIN